MTTVAPPMLPSAAAELAASPLGLVRIRPAVWLLPLAGTGRHSPATVVRSVTFVRGSGEKSARVERTLMRFHRRVCRTAPRGSEVMRKNGW